MTDDKPAAGSRAADETQPVGAVPADPADPAAPSAPAAAPGSTVAHESAAPAGPRLRDRMWGLRVLLGVGIAAVIIGGLGGFGIAKASEGGDDRGFGPGRGGQNFGQRGPGGPNGGPMGQNGGGFGRNGGGPGQQQNGQQNGQDAPQAPSSSPSTSARTS